MKHDTLKRRTTTNDIVIGIWKDGSSDALSSQASGYTKANSSQVNESLRLPVSDVGRFVSVRRCGAKLTSDRKLSKQWSYKFVVLVARMPYGMPYAVHKQKYKNNTDSIDENFSPTSITIPIMNMRGGTYMKSLTSHSNLCMTFFISLYNKMAQWQWLVARLAAVFRYPEVDILIVYLD